MKLGVSRQPATATPAPAAQQTVYVIASFFQSSGGSTTLDVAYVADEDLALEMALEDRALAEGVAVYALRFNPNTPLRSAPRLVFGCGSLPADAAALLADALLDL